MPAVRRRDVLPREAEQRPSWKDIFERKIYADPAIYWPMHYFRTIGFPAFPHDPYG
jgi:hypothetical protein